mmetsp:Transcript_12834/g.51191  ORF Transcript_12834/g.51191 Transcript_12834/m.51191 type:complete len:547 (-) Transcript_12834:459-2099(-)
MVGGLVEVEDVGLHESDGGEDDAVFLSAGEGSNGLVVCVGGKAELSEGLAVGVATTSALHVREAPGEVLEGRDVEVELVSKVLGKVADAEVLVDRDGALRGLELAEKQAQQRTLAASVRAHQRNACVHVDAKVHLVKDFLWLCAVPGGVRERHVVHLDHRVVQLPGRVWEVELNRVFLNLVHELRLQLLQLALLLLLHLARHLLAGSLPRLSSRLLVAMQLALALRQCLLLLLVEVLLRPPLRLQRLLEGLEVSLVGDQLLLVQVHDPGADVVEEGAVVGDDDEGLLPGPAEVLLEPNDGVEVEVVGGLVQQQEGGLAEEGAREGNAHPPAAGELLRRLLLHLGRELQTREDLGCPGGRLVGTDGGELGIDDGEAGGTLGLLLVGELGLLHLELVLLLEELKADFVGGEDAVDGRLVRAVSLLLDVEEVEVGGDARQLPGGDLAEHSALSRAVRAHKAVSLSHRERDRGLLEELVAVERQAERPDPQAVLLASVLVLLLLVLLLRALEGNHCLHLVVLELLVQLPLQLRGLLLGLLLGALDAAGSV